MLVYLIFCFSIFAGDKFLLQTCPYKFLAPVDRADRSIHFSDWSDSPTTPAVEIKSTIIPKPVKSRIFFLVTLY